MLSKHAPAIKSMLKRRIILALSFVAATVAFAQKPDQVKWSLTLSSPSAAPGSKILARMTGRIDPGWHVYSLSTPAAIPTTIELAPNAIVERYRVLQPKPKRNFDPGFNSDTETYEGEVAFLLELELKKQAPAGPAEFSVTARYQTCNDKLCIPPVRRTATATLAVDPAAQIAAIAIPSGYAEGHPPAQSAAGGPAPVPAGSQAWASFLLVAFGFGLAAIFTPCVFPMIPITMSYFLGRQTGSRRDSIMQAVVFCLGIVVLFSGLGLLATAALGPFGISQLGSSPWINGFIAALFIAFGLSLLGAFEITIPSSVLTALNQSSGKGGFAGTLLMGLTFSLASFACVGPFVGTLLAASVQGGGARPFAGMSAFASGLALPFFLLAMFPSYLQRMPRSGAWLARVKVVMGFVILAASLKYLASLDQVLRLGVLTRERFLAMWIVLFAMAGLYLLGFVRLEGIKPEERLGLGRLLAGMAFVVFAISLLPGMLGGKLGDLDAYVPAGSETASPGGGASQNSLIWMKDQYREALSRARAEGKLVFIDFTGYACANCHWMQANMFTRPEIAAPLRDFVLVELYTDGTDKASEENQALELAKFNTIATPFYAILDANGKVIATFPGLTKDSQEYLAFLQKGAKPAGPVESASAPAIAAPSASAPPGQAEQGLPQNLKKLDGSELDASALGGKVVVVNFWATWCVPCVGEIPGFNKLHQEYASKGVVVLGVSIDDGAAQVGAFLKKHPMEYPVALASEAISEKYTSGPIPVTLVFDRSGKQIKRFEGFTPAYALEAAVQQAL